MRKQLEEARVRGVREGDIGEERMRTVVDRRFKLMQKIH